MHGFESFVPQGPLLAYGPSKAFWRSDHFACNISAGKLGSHHGEIMMQNYPDLKINVNHQLFMPPKWRWLMKLVL